MGPLPDLLDHHARLAIGHLVRRQQRDARLLVRGVRATIPVVPTCRTLILGVVAVVLVIVVGIGRHVLHVAQRRRGTHARATHVDAAELHGQIIRRPIGVIGAMATRARLLARRRERGSKKSVLPRAVRAGMLGRRSAIIA
jgi:hypothetical protein